MKRKITLLGGFFVLCAFQYSFAQSSDSNLLNVVSNGNTETHSLTTLQKITFVDGKMQLFTQTGTTDYDLSTLSKMYFDLDQTTGLDELSKPYSTVVYDSATELLYLNNDATVHVLICDLNGRIIKMDCINQLNSCISLAELPKGIYLIRINNQAIKIAK